MRAPLINSIRSIVNTGGKGRIPEMEGLRGLAVALVFFVHYVAVLKPLLVGSPIATELAYGAAFVGHLGVDIFFILSGYLIYGSVLPGKLPVAEFARRRLRRIYPTFLAVFAMYVALSVVYPTENKIPSGLVNAAIYLGANALLLPGIFPITPLITVAWSLSYEVFFYLSAPLLVWSLRFSKWSRQTRVVALVAGSAAFLALCWVAEITHLRLIEFAAGALVWETTKYLKERNAKLPAAMTWFGAPLLVLTLGVAVKMSDRSSFIAEFGRVGEFIRLPLLAVMLAVSMLIALQGRGMLAEVLRLTPARWLGNVSYSYYLIHGLTLKAVGMVVFKFVSEPSLPIFFALLPFAFVATLFPAAGLYLLVESRFSTDAAPVRTSGQRVAA